MKDHIKLLLLISVAISIGSSCGWVNNRQNDASGIQDSTVNNRAEKPNSKLEISPVGRVSDDYQIIEAEIATITVTAERPAQETQIFYQPVTAEQRALKLRTLIPSKQNNLVFRSEIKVPRDLNGEIWAEIRYSTGEVRETARILVAADSAGAQNDLSSSQTDKARTSQTAPNDKKNIVQSLAERLVQTEGDESARADKYTGGAIKRDFISTGAGKISITINVPTFTLTLWQGAKEIKTYYVGVGRKNYPIPIGLRTAAKIIINPDWIPPDSSWVRRSSSVEPYERISADDPLNPLGKIKIPLGDAYLLHEAESPADLGNLVSHGCVRVLRADLFDLTELIAAAQNLPVSKNEIDTRRQDTRREVIELNAEVPVDINYDSMVIENNTLSIYPDVYDRKTNTVENLRAELVANGIEAEKLSSDKLRSVLDRVTHVTKFVIALADVKTGEMLEKGKVEPLIPPQIKQPAAKNKS